MSNEIEDIKDRINNLIDCFKDNEKITVHRLLGKDLKILLDYIKDLENTINPNIKKEVYGVIIKIDMKINI